MPVALITDAELMSSLAVIRSLGRRGFTIVAASADSSAVGFRSRYTTVRLHDPAWRRSPELIRQALVEAVERHGVELLVPVTDETLLTVVPYAKDFPSVCTLATAAVEALYTTMDKAATLKLAADIGIPVPDSVLVTDPWAADLSIGDLGLPLVMKPQYSRVLTPEGHFKRFSTSYACDETTARRRMRSGEEASENIGMLLQRYWPGSGVGVSMLTSNGRPLAAFQHRRLRELPPSGGVGALCESVDLDRQLYDYASRLLAALHWTGLAMVEFKVRDGEVVLMEVNGRIWGSLPLAVHSGMDFPAKLSDLFLQESPASIEVDTSYQRGVRGHHMAHELDWIEAVLRRREQPPAGPPWPRRAALGAMADLFRPSYRYDGIAVDDPLPAISDVASTLRRFSRRLVNEVERRLA
ncbi:MAG: ATP-grasp domain-containing protein [Actinomycetota bacterium]|nr:ATP-grasp domain-containing protein [Actinomycetota bacterium]